jgi:pyrrolysine biosynthesis protein PylC
VGGGLQGVEAAYLAIKAGWDVIVIDKDPGVPAARLGHIFMRMDVTHGDDLFRLIPGVAIVIPALENDAALFSLERQCRSAGIPFAFDLDAYAISSSKLKSNRLFARLGIPAPRPWPEGEFPLVVKPERGSGSKGVKIIRNLSRLESDFPGPASKKGRVIQEYLPGPSYSLEVIGFPGNYKALQVTDLEIDAAYDCKRVSAPTALPPGQAARFADISLQIAAAISLKGIMDVEAILHRGELKVLEIDARLPSQTPITVYRSTGLNMVEALGELFLKGDMGDSFKGKLANPGGAVFEHIRVSSNRLEVRGEGIMKSGGPLQLQPDFFGADEAVSDYEPGKKQWVATLILWAAGKEEALLKRDKTIKNIQRHFKLGIYKDNVPEF